MPIGRFKMKRPNTSPWSYSIFKPWSILRYPPVENSAEVSALSAVENSASGRILQAYNEKSR